MRQWWPVLNVFLLLAPAAMVSAAHAENHGAVATVHPLATRAAADVMRQGGNAIDGIVAAGLTLGVVDSHNSGIGGGCFILLRLSNHTIVAIDGREAAPAAAHRDMFLKNGKPDNELSLTGPLASGVPGALAAYAWVATNYGRLTLRQHLLNAAQVAEQGFPIDGHYAALLKENADELKLFAASREIFLRPDSTPWRQGEILRQPALAATYRAIAEHGVAWFYEGPFASATSKWMKENGGLLSRDDFRTYQVRSRPFIRSRYRGYEIVGFPPPSSGGIHVAQILNILEQFDLRNLGPRSPGFVHLAAEAMKRAFADRAHWLGDSDFVNVPAGLTNREYARELAAQIDQQRVTPVPGHGTPPGAPRELLRHTTHFSTADGEGNWVACTATINTSFGSKVVVPGTGVLLNNEMDDFSIQPGVLNYFGLVGAEANAVAARKRPLSSMSPTLVLTNDVPILSVGAAGGPTIISQTLLAIVNQIDFGMSLQDALAAPRFHHQWRPDELRIERTAGDKTIGELRQRGHVVKVVQELGATQAVGRDVKGNFTAGHDPRNEGLALAW